MLAHAQKASRTIFWCNYYIILAMIEQVKNHRLGNKRITLHTYTVPGHKLKTIFCLKLQLSIYKLSFNNRSTRWSLSLCATHYILQRVNRIVQLRQSIRREIDVEFILEIVVYLRIVTTTVVLEGVVLVAVFDVILDNVRVFYRGRRSEEEIRW